MFLDKTARSKFCMKTNKLSQNIVTERRSKISMSTEVFQNKPSRLWSMLHSGDVVNRLYSVKLLPVAGPGHKRVLSQKNSSAWSQVGFFGGWRCCKVIGVGRTLTQ